MLKHQLLPFLQEMTHCSCWRKQSGRFKAHFMAFKSGYCFSLIVSHLNSHNFYDLSKYFNTDIKILGNHPCYSFDLPCPEIFLQLNSIQLFSADFHFQLFFSTSIFNFSLLIAHWKKSA